MRLLLLLGLLHSFLLKTISSQQDYHWVHQVAIETAGQLITSLDDRNFTNLVIIGSSVNDDSDQFMAESLEVFLLNQDNPITIAEVILK
jgi:hypothetical protein